MNKLKLNISRFLLLIFYLRCVQSQSVPLPHKYCLPPLNRSDCGKNPTAVFSYYKPGSRCEIETWRGCPTANMFENEYHCSHYCIGRLEFFGRGKGSWTGRLSESINDLNIKELEGLDRLLEKADSTLETDQHDDHSLEVLLNKSSLPPKVVDHDTEQKLAISKTTEMISGETTVDGFIDGTDSGVNATEDTEITKGHTEAYTKKNKNLTLFPVGTTDEMKVTAYTSGVDHDTKQTLAISKTTEMISGETTVDGFIDGTDSGVNATEDTEVTEGHTEAYTKKKKKKLTLGPIGITDEMKVTAYA